MTKDQNRELALQYISNARSVQSLAEEWDLSVQGMRSKLDSDAMRLLIAEELAATRDIVARAQAYIQFNLLDYLKAADSIAREKGHPKQLEAILKLVDKVWPTVAASPAVQNNYIQMEASELQAVAGMFATAAAQLAERNSGSILESRFLHEGESALPDAGAARSEDASG